MTTTVSLEFLLPFILLTYVYELVSAAEGDEQFIYNGFSKARLHLEGPATILSNGLLQLTNAEQQTGHAFYKLPLRFKKSSTGLVHPLSFSTNFVFAIVPEHSNLGAFGMAFVMSSSMDFKQALPNQYLGILNASSNGSPSNHLLAVEFDTVRNPEFDDINNNHVGIDVNSMKSIESAPAAYFSKEEDSNQNLELASGEAMQVWVEYDQLHKLLNVTLAPLQDPKPNKPLLSSTIDFSPIFSESVYVGFSASTGSLLPTNHNILGWSFNINGQAQSIDISNLPSFPHPTKPREHKNYLTITIAAIGLSVALISAVVAAGYIVRRRRYKEIREDWEQEYGPQRFSYKCLYRATNGFQDRNLLGSGGFGKVYRGTLASTNVEVAVKRVSHDSTQGMKEFVAEIACMGRLRHRNLVGLLGYCRRKGELLLVYDYMPNGSLDKFLFGNEKPNLNWAQRYRILRGIASGLLYLHQEWERVILHRDVKASNVLLDADLNGRLGDFGLARLHDHGANPETTRVVGTVGYLAPELTRTSKATTSTDIFAFGAFMLEVACGRRPLENQAPPEKMLLIEWVFESWKQGNILATSDPRLEGDTTCVSKEVELVMKLGLLCSHSNPTARPSMRQVMQCLDGDTILPEISPECSVGFYSGELGEFSVPLPSSSGMASANSMFSTESILHTGR